MSVTANAAAVVVVGAGIVGAATAWTLARAGVGVVLLEQHDLGHALGSSHGSSRIFRFSYAEPHWVRDCQASLPLWRAAEAAFGVELVTTLGGLDLGPRAAANASALAECGAAAEWLSPSDVQERAPWLRIPDGMQALWQPDAGIVHADRAVRAFADGALVAGAAVHERVRVTALEAGAQSVRVVAQDGSAWTAGAVVVAAGVLVDPDVPRPAPDAALVGRVANWVRDRFPGVDPRPVGSETCLYTTTVDESFVVERHGRVVVASACSGHGFKFAPLTAARVAALARAALDE